MKQERPPEPLPLRREADEARKLLKEFDDRLDFWWNERAGCWSVREWLKRSGIWSHTFDWKGPGGQYRPLLPIYPILAKLSRCDWEAAAFRYGMGDGFQAAVEEDMGRGRRQHLERRKADRERLRQDYIKNVMKRADDFLPGTGGAKLKAYNEARSEYKALAEALSND